MRLIVWHLRYIKYLTNARLSQKFRESAQGVALAGDMFCPASDAAKIDSIKSQLIAEDFVSDLHQLIRAEQVD